MKILILVLLLFFNFALGSVIIGDQTKVSITGGSAFVESGKMQKNLNSGEIIMVSEDGTLSDAKRLQRGDLNSVYTNLKPAEDESEEKDLINITYPEVKIAIAKKIKRQLMNLNIDPMKIVISEPKKDYMVDMFLKQTDKELIKVIYPLYYKTALEFYMNKANKGLLPTLKMQKRHLYYYHKSVFNEFSIYDYGKDENNEL